MIRHGERGDSVPGFRYKNKVDPPLTPLGVQQAHDTGIFLKKFITEKGFKFDKIIVCSSPFLRCMMTAAQIANQLGVDNVQINYTASECLTT